MASAPKYWWCNVRGNHNWPYNYPYCRTLHCGRESQECELKNPSNTFSNNKKYLNKQNSLQIQVFAGDHTMNGKEEHEVELSVASITNHSSYNSQTLDNDFAILTLSEELTFNEQISPICMPDASKTYYGLDAVVSGWGTTSSVRKI